MSGDRAPELIILVVGAHKGSTTSVSIPHNYGPAVQTSDIAGAQADSTRDQPRSGNQRPISRSAESGESDPCTRLNWVLSA